MDSHFVESHLGGYYFSSMDKEDTTAITEVNFFSGTNVEQNLSSIDFNEGTLLNAHIVLGDSSDSSITYKVSVANRSNKPIKFKGDVVDSEFYDNPLITYNITGISENEIVPANTIKDLYITFMYAGEDISDNTLENGYINLKFVYSYIIKYNSNGGNGDMNDQVAFYEEDTTLTTCSFTKTDYHFNHWNTIDDDSGDSYNDNHVINIVDNTITELNLYAFYEVDDNNQEPEPSNLDNPDNGEGNNNSCDHESEECDTQTGVNE